jgi:pimeloyl-ACP methyl ester carboxylesterase
MGGKVAMTLAIRYPGLIGRMLVADIAPVPYRHDYDDLIEPILSLQLDRFATRTEVDHALRSHIREDSLRSFLLQNLVRDGEGWRWRVNWRAIQAEMDSLTGFDAMPEDWSGGPPALFVRGSRSDYIGATEVEIIERHFSNASIATIEGAGHWLHAEKPQEFCSLALDFLRRD